MEIPEYFTEWSIRMTEVLDDIGAGRDTVSERRRTYLWRECMLEIIDKYCGGVSECCFHFGSQSEGTTTPGLQSDIDILLSANHTNIMRVWEDWEAGMYNYLMLHDDTTPPQQYLLQNIRRDKPEPEAGCCTSHFVKKDSGQALLSAERFKQCIEDEMVNKEMITRNGPSVSNFPDWDMVMAFHVCKPLPEIQQWVERCRGRHWPPAQLLDAARVAPCFLVPSGHPDSDYSREEWRLSPNLIERMLMFSFNMTQIKCYIILKLIKKSLFTKIVGESITSFHCKTLMFYTIERTHPSLWFEHNLMFLISSCLYILRKSLRFGKLPHYIIHGMNLFDGKISRIKQRRLLVYIDSMINSNLQEVLHIDIDKLGFRLRACSMLRIVKAGDIRRVCLRDSISLLLKFESLMIFANLFTLQDHKQHITRSNTTFQQDIRFVLRISSTNVRLKNVSLEIIKHMYAIQNSMQLSTCLRLGHVIDSDIIRRFKYTLCTDVASSRLKLASILYCSGHIHAALRVLVDVEMRLHSNVKAVCGCHVVDSNMNVFNNMLSGKSENEFSESPFAFCVKFSWQESFCVPVILLFEMHRNFPEEEEVAPRHSISNRLMDNAEVDARPFLHYLQYLTYGALGERNKQLHSLSVLEYYLSDVRNRMNMFHLETACNLLGHCYEMEENYDAALHYCIESLRYRGTHNAALRHIRRVIHLIRDFSCA